MHVDGRAWEIVRRARASTPTGPGGRPGTESGEEPKNMLIKIAGMTASAAFGAFASIACAQASPVQWRAEDGGNGHWYQGILITPPVTAETGTAVASARGAHLVDIASSAEWSFVSAVSDQTSYAPTAPLGRSSASLRTARVARGGVLVHGRAGRVHELAPRQPESPRGRSLRVPLHPPKPSMAEP